METIRCSKCGEHRPLSDFPPNKSTTSGLASYCRTCYRIHKNTYYASHKDGHKKRMAKYTKKNHDKIKSHQREMQKIRYAKNPAYYLAKKKIYAASHKEQIAKHARQYRMAHPVDWKLWWKNLSEKEKTKRYINLRRRGKRPFKKTQAYITRMALKRISPEEKIKRRARVKKWADKNHDKRIAQKHNRRARVNGNGGKFSGKEWTELCNKFDNRCVCCGIKAEDTEIKKLTPDHIEPVAPPFHGTSYIGNIQPLCNPCNHRKWKRIVDFRQNPFAGEWQIDFL